ITAFRAMYVVDEVEDPTVELTVDEAKKYDEGAKVGDLVKVGDMPDDSFGRIHAQMAQQLFRQRLREVEREQGFGQYAQREAEINAGTVEIKAIAREAGSRSKVAVASRQEGLDPVGATVGQRGGRVQAVVAELGGEKIDIIPWNEDPALFVANALSPAQVVNV